MHVWFTVHILSLMWTTIPTAISQSYFCDTNSECAGSIIDCPAGNECNVECTADSACNGATINCPSGADCSVTCSRASACAGAIFHAEEASHFTLDCETAGSFTCTYLTIYFPPNNAGTPRTTIYARDDSYSQEHQYYAINGFLDVNIIFGGSFSIIQSSTMHCNVGYTDSCAIKAQSWSECETGGSNDNCDNPVVLTSSTPAPTTTTSASPTRDPSKVPTKNPTKNPITAAPTSTPTLPPNQLQEDGGSAVYQTPSPTTQDPLVQDENTNDSNQSGVSIVIFVVVSVVSLLLLIGFVLMLVMYLRQRKALESSQKEKGEDDVEINMTELQPGRTQNACVASASMSSLLDSKLEVASRSVAADGIESSTPYAMPQSSTDGFLAQSPRLSHQTPASPHSSVLRQVSAVSDGGKYRYHSPAHSLHSNANSIVSNAASLVLMSEGIEGLQSDGGRPRENSESMYRDKEEQIATPQQDALTPKGAETDGNVTAGGDDECS